MPRVIKRYANRKLYDQQASRYVSLEDLLALIRAGEDVQVLDAATGADLTSVTLAQVILERERARPGGLPATFLHQVIRHGEAWQDFVTTSMRASLEGMLTTQRQADAFFRDWAARTGLLSRVAAPEPQPEPEPEPEPAEGAAVGQAPTAGAEEQGAQPGGDGEQVGELRRQLAALEARLRALEGR